MIALVVRADGTYFGLTDHDESFTWDNGWSGPTLYKSTTGIDATNAEQSIGTSPGSLQVKTIQQAVGSQVTAADLVAGFYEGARVWVYEIDYTNLTAGRAVILNQYLFGKFTIRDSHVELELTELFYRLKQNTGRILCSGCQVNRYGDKECDPTGTLRARDSNTAAVVTLVSGNFVLQFSGDSQAAGFYDYGEVIFTSGALVPAPAFEVKVHMVPSAGVCQVTLRDPLVRWPNVGDTATLVRGCDRHFATCQSIVNGYNPSGTNVENFHGLQLPLPDDIAYVGRQPGS
jgi:uncharacterized phage protein (TIGR02218 family)